jgi:hypothetical protein
MAKRIVLAGVLGGLAMFVWSFIAHMVLGLGLVGIKDLPSEQAVLTTMHENVPQSGMYLFPALTAKSGSREQQNAAMKVYQDKIASGPSGILIYHPSGQTALSAGQLLTEFGTNVLQGLLAALLLSLATGVRSYASRVAFVTAAGVLAAISTNISYWNWYGFPGSYTAAYTFTQIVGFVCIGLIAAGMIKHGSGSATKAAGAA